MSDARWNRLRLRKERRARDSHERWTILGALKTPGATLRFDGMQLRKAADCSLYVGAFASGRAFHVHPNWLELRGPRNRTATGRVTRCRAAPGRA